jgi:hypothetical protein
MQAIEINLRTKKYTVILDTAAVLAFEERAKKGLFEVFRSDAPSFTDILNLVWAMTRTHHHYLTFEKLRGEVELSDYQYLMESVSQFIKLENFGMKKAEEGEAPAGDAPPLAGS